METRPGVTTTEFWTSLFTGLYMVANTTGVVDQIPKSWAAVATAVIAGAYAVSRGQAKSGVPDDGTAKGLFARKGQ